MFASIYSGRLADAPAVQALPEETRAVMGESMAAAQQVIAQVPPAAAPAVRNAVETAFLDGQWIGSLVAAGIALAAAVVVAVMLPARERQTVTTTTEIKQHESEEVCA